MTSHRRTAPPTQGAATNEKRRVSRLGITNESRRAREHLTSDEVAKLVKAAGSAGRHKVRDRLLIEMAYRHALRVAELVDVRWGDIDLDAKTLIVRRQKGGLNSTHVLDAKTELAPLRKLRAMHPDADYVFLSERTGSADKMTTDNVRQIVRRAGEAAGLGPYCHPHQLRHAAGHTLINADRDIRRIQLFMGHKSIVHTVKYTALAKNQFRGFWPD